MLDNRLRLMRNTQLMSMMGSEIYFFKPNDQFFEALSPYRDEAAFVDAGAGMGHVTKEALAQGFNMLAVDLLVRENQWEQVIQTDAESMPYSENLWLLMCRPDHSGWAYDALEAALKKGAKVFYAGLAENLERDLDEYLGRESKRWSNVGENNEILLMFEPSALSAH